MPRKILMLCLVLSGVLFAQYSSVGVNWLSPADSAVLRFDGTHWVYDATAGPDTNYECNMYGSPGLDSSSLEVTISRDGGPFEEVTGYFADFAGYDYAYLAGSFNSLGLVPGSFYTLCVHIANTMGVDTTECVHFSTENLPDHCPPILVGWNLMPDEASCFSGNLRFLVCDNNPDCLEQSGVNPASVEARLNIPARDTSIDVSSHITFTHSPGGHCMEFTFTLDVPCDSLAYLLMPGEPFEFCVSVADSVGNAFPEPVCTTFVMCPDTCPPTAYNPHFGSDTLYFDGSHWHDATGGNMWNFGFDDFYSPCPVSPFDTAQIGLLIRPCGGGEWSFVPADSFAFFMDEAYCRMSGSAYGFLDDLGLECGSCYKVRAQVADVVGNVGTSYGTVTIYTQSCSPSPTDTCPPEISWVVPREGDTLEYDGIHWGSPRPGGGLDTAFAVSIEDFGCASSCLNETTLVISIRNCDDTLWNIIDGYETTFSCDYGNAWGSLNSLGLEPGHCYQICAEITDNDGNHAENCVTFYTRPEPTDTCPPEVSWTVPVEGDTLEFDGGRWWAHRPGGGLDSMFSAFVEEFGCPGTGIDTSSIEISYHRCGDSIWYTVDEFTYPMMWDYGEISFPIGELSLEPGNCYEICIEVSDSAGNRAGECQTFYTPGEAPADTCPPAVTEWSIAPGDTYCFEGRIWFNLEDPLDSAGCPVCSGVDLPSVVVTVVAHEDTFVLRNGEGLMFDTYGECGVWVGLNNHFYSLHMGDEVTICVDAADHDGNVMPTDCINFTVCDTTVPTPADTCPPEVVEWHPAPGSTYCYHGMISASIVDPHDTDECPHCSGLDLGSLEGMVVVTTPAGVDTFTFVPDSGLMVDPAGPCAAWVGFNPDHFALPPGSEVDVYLAINDSAGNHMLADNHFTVCDTTTPEDTCPPVVTEWSIAPGDTYCFGGHIWFNLEDPHDIDGCPTCSGIDLSTVEVTVIAHGDTFVLTGEHGLGFDPFGMCGTWVGLVDSAYSLNPGDEVSICVTAADSAGNVMSPECIEFPVCDTTTPPADTCPPVVVEWHPEPGFVYCYHGAIGARIVDPHGTDECPDCSGLDIGSLEGMMVVTTPAGEVDTFAFVPDSGLAVDPMGPCMLWVGFVPDYYDLPPGSEVSVYLAINDDAGNHMLEDNHFTVCDTTAPPADTCPPVVVEWHPEEVLCPPTAPVWLRLSDISDECGCSGIDVPSLEVHILTDSGEFALVPDSGLAIEMVESLCVIDVAVLHDYFEITPGTGATLCVSGVDLAGNDFSYCHYFRVCDTTVEEDTCPPVVERWNPMPGSTYCYEGIVSAYVVDPHSTDECPYCSGLDISTLEAAMEITTPAGEVDTLFFTPDSGLMIDPAGPCAAWIGFDPDYFDLPPGSEVRVVVAISDNAGNRMHEFNYFTVCDTTLPEDVCAPVVHWLPDTGCLPTGGPVTVVAIDPFDSIECPVPSGIDDSSITLTVIVGDDTLDVSDECEISPHGDFGVEITWFPVGFALPADSDVEACVRVVDMAGNVTESCNTYHTCPAVVDTCPPEVMWSVPSADIPETLRFAHGRWFAHGDSLFSVRIMEFGCPPTGIEDYSVLFGSCDMTPEMLPDSLYHAFDSTDYVVIFGNFNALGLEPDGCYQLCVSAMDGAGNPVLDCVTFYTEPVESADFCPPYVYAWFPSADSCIPPDAGIGLMLADPFDDECPVASGVDESSVRVTAQVGSGSPEDVTEECDIYTYGMYVGVEWGHDVLPEGTSVTLCVSAADNNGNWMDSCYTWRTCGEPTVDECPPVIGLIEPPMDECVELPAEFQFYVFDDTSCVVSGVPESNIHLALSVNGGDPTDITDECHFAGAPEYGYAVNWNAGRDAFEPGDTVQICIIASDGADNLADTCFVWTICPAETVEDVCPPVVVRSSVEEGDTVPADGILLAFELEDPVDDSICTICSGIAESTVVLTVLHGDEIDSFDITSGLRIIPTGCGAYAAVDTGVFHMEPGEEYTACIVAADGAGNYMDEYCVNFYTYPETTVADVWPPCFSDWTPEDGAEGVPTTTSIDFTVCDMCEGAEVSTGVDSVGVVIAVVADDDTTYYWDYERSLTPLSCGGYAVHIEPVEEFPECATVIVYAWAYDSAFNETYDTLVFNTYCPSETVDIWPPCVVELDPDDGDTVSTPDVMVSAWLCDACEGADFATGVDSTTVVMTVNGDDVSDELLFEPLDCFGYQIIWNHEPLDVGHYEVCVSAADFAGNGVDTCWVFDVLYDTTYEFSVIEPLNGTWTNNRFKQIIGYFTGHIPDDFEFTVNGETYTLDSPEVALVGDTLVFTPTEPWEDGDTVCYDFGTVSGCFYVDLTPPEIEFITPSCGDTLADSPAEISVAFHDELSGVDESTVGIRVATMYGNWDFAPGMEGVSWDPASGELTVDLASVGVELYGRVRIYAWAGDSPDYTYDLSPEVMPNYGFEHCHFFVVPPVRSVIAGTVVDTISGEPIAGARVFVFPYIHGWYEWLYPDAFASVEVGTTDASGNYAVEVGMGVYMVVLVTPPDHPYSLVFWDGHFYPLDADPVVVDASAPDTIRCDFQIGEIMARALASHIVSGEVVDEDGEPIRDAFVVFVLTDDDEDGDEEEFVVSAGMTGADGSFSVPVKDGTYWMEVVRPGYLPTYFGGSAMWSGGDTIYVSGTDVTDLDVTMSSVPSGMGPHTVSGVVYRVVDSTAETMRGVPVYLVEPTSEEIKYAGVSIYDGTYEIPNVADGVYKVVADRAHYEPQGEWDVINVVADAEQDIYLQRVPSGIDEPRKLPVSIKLLDANPNPFNASTAIDFVVPAAGEVKLEITDLLGRPVATLVDGTLSAGHYVALWTAKDLNSGIYFARLRVAGRTEQIKLLLIK